MSTLSREPNLVRPDEFYQALIEAHNGLTDAESAALNARLVLLLANQIGDLGMLQQAIADARASMDPRASMDKRSPTDTRAPMDAAKP